MHIMEELPRGALTQGRVSFQNQKQLQTCKNGKFFEQRSWTTANDKTARRNKPYHHLPSCYESLDIPMHTMQFLCRSWSPTASNFLHTFSSSNILDSEQKCNIEGHEEKVDHDADVLGEEEEIAQVDNAKHDTMAAQSIRNKIWTRILVERSIPSVPKSCTSLNINKHIQGWLREKSLTSIWRWRKEKKKEDVRLLAAKIHAALSVTQLAAAIAGFSATNSMEVANETNANEHKKMCNVVAYATALLASACAEAAESVGAHKTRVTSAINSGLATQTPADMVTLTAAAATSLRGAETLTTRAKPGLQFAGNKELVKLAAKLSIITPSGQKALRLVCIHLKHRQLKLTLEKKYLGILTTSKEYTIIQVMREKKSQGHYLLGIKCNGGNIKLLFEDKEQFLEWMSNISSTLQMYDPFVVQCFT